MYSTPANVLLNESVGPPLSYLSSQINVRLLAHTLSLLVLSPLPYPNMIAQAEGHCKA